MHDKDNSQQHTSTGTCTQYDMTQCTVLVLCWFWKLLAFIPFYS